MMISFIFHVTKGSLRLYFYAGKMLAFLLYMKRLIKHSLQPCICNGPKNEINKTKITKK